MTWKRRLWTIVWITVTTLVVIVLVATMIFNVPVQILGYPCIPHRELWLKIWLKDPDFRPNVLEYPHAREISRGMTAGQVTQLVGTPKEIGTLRDGVYGSETATPQALHVFPQVWIYHFFGWDSPIVVSFGKDGKVAMVNWGHG